MSIIDKLDNILTKFENRLFWVMTIFAPLYWGGHVIWAMVR